MNIPKIYRSYIYKHNNTTEVYNITFQIILHLHMADTLKNIFKTVILIYVIWKQK